YRIALAGNLVAREVEAEDHPSFYVCGRIRRVDVLLRLILAHRPGGEREHRTALVADRNHEALGEEVGPVPAHQTGLQRIGKRAALGAQVLGKATARRTVPELEAPGSLLPDVAGLEQPPSRLAGGQLPQHVLVILGRQLQHRQGALAEVGPLLLLRAELLPLAPAPPCQELPPPPLARLLDQLDEREDVP